jgi:hypothetical protein
MKNYLSKQNHKFVTHAKSIKSDQEFWLFVKSEGLQLSIDQFNQEKSCLNRQIILEKSCPKRHNISLV